MEIVNKILIDHTIHKSNLKVKLINTVQTKIPIKFTILQMNMMEMMEKCP